MKTRETTMRLMRFEAEEKARKVQDLEMMIGDMDQIAQDLERQIRSEEERSGIKDPVHYAYSTFAKAAAERRKKIAASIDDLQNKLSDAIRERDAAMEDLQASQAADEREQNRGRRKGDQTPENVQGPAPAPAYSDH